MEGQLIAMRNTLNKLPEYMADNIKDLSFNLDEAKEYNDSFTYNLMSAYPSMFEKYNDIVNDSAFFAYLNYYKEHVVNGVNYEYDDIEYDEYDDVGDDAI